MTRDDEFEAMRREVHGPALRLALRLLREPADAKDAVQDALCTAYRSWERFRGEADRRTWFHRILVNRCLSTMRRREVRRRFAALFALGGGPDEATGRVPSWTGEDRGPEAEAERRVLVGRVASVVERLSPGQRTAFVLRHGEGMTVPEVASAMGISVETARTHLARAMERVREALR